ncbi:MAG: tRNA lysidine(34) synthetase TilS [Candidatus Eisenbacteria bacterium]|nr:tRNA lysidine(34) synthetase TilS [Candidatus Eisenbacteria bacterium]
MPVVKLRRALAALPLEGGESWVVAVSGGADSVFLLRALHLLAPDFRLHLAVAHLDHGLRGEDSRADARSVAALAAELGTAFRLKTLPAGALDLPGRSPEEAAREARHGFLESVRAELGARRIALAHHADDQSETILWNFLRGTGPAGLAGMRRVSADGRLVRPLLDIPREEIRAGMAARGWDFREDLTNLDTSRPRNLLRHRVLPMLESEVNPGLRASLAGGADIFRSWVELVSEMAEKAMKEALLEPGDTILTLDCAPLMAYPEAVRKFALGKALEGFEGPGGWTRAHLAALDHLLASKDSGGRRVSLPGNLEAARERDRLVVYPSEADPPFESFDLAVPGELVLPDGSRITARRAGPHDVPAGAGPEPGRVWINAAALRGPLRVRRRRPGDRFEPWGLGSDTKLKDFLIGARVPRRLRRRLWLLSDSEHILWVLRLRPSERLRLGANAEEVIEVRLEPPHFHGE